MKLLITEQQCDFLIEEYYEEYNSIDDYFTYLDEITREIFSKIKGKEKMSFRRINPSQFHTALNDFVKFGKLTHFPTKYIFRWKALMVENVAMLDALTSIHGHSSSFPIDEFNDIFNYNHETNEDENGEFSQWLKMRYEETEDEDYIKRPDWNTAYEYLENVYNIDDVVPFFESGHAVLSDFGLEPLQKLASRLMEQDDANEILITIDKMMEVSHPRGDLAELFIIGGSDSLEKISGLHK